MLANILKIWRRRLFVVVCAFSALSAIATAVNASSGTGSVFSAASSEMQGAAKLASTQSAAVSWPASAKNPAAVAAAKAAAASEASTQYKDGRLQRSAAVRAKVGESRNEGSLLRDLGSGILLDFLYPKEQVMYMSKDSVLGGLRQAEDIDSIAIEIYRQDNGAYDGMLYNVLDTDRSLQWVFAPASEWSKKKANAMMQVIFSLRRNEGLFNAGGFRHWIRSGENILIGPSVAVLVKDHGHIFGFGDQLWINGGSIPLNLESLGKIEITNNGEGVAVDQYEASIGAQGMPKQKPGEVGGPPTHSIDVGIASAIGDPNAITNTEFSNLKFDLKFVETGGVIGAGGGSTLTFQAFENPVSGEWDFGVKNASAHFNYGFFTSAKAVIGLDLGIGYQHTFTLAFDPQSGEQLSTTEKTHLGFTLDSFAALGIAFAENLGTGDTAMIFNGTLLGFKGEVSFNSADMTPLLTGFSYSVPLTSFNYDFHNFMYDGFKPEIGPPLNPFYEQGPFTFNY
ncbi:MAG: hypothetical protein V3V18_08255 [Methylococcales bacterium]